MSSYDSQSVLAHQSMQSKALPLELSTLKATPGLVRPAPAQSRATPASPPPQPSASGDTGATQACDAVTSPIGALERVIIIVKGRVMHLYAEFGDKLVHIQLKLKDNYEVARSKAFESLSMVKSAAQSYQLKLDENVKVIKAKVTDRVTLLYTKASTSSHNCKLMLQTKALESYTRAKDAVQSLPVPIKVKTSLMYIHNQLSSLSVHVKNGCMHIYGKMGEVMFRIRTQCADGAEVAKAKAFELVSRVAKQLEPYAMKLKNGAASVRCKIGDATLYVSRHVVESKTRAKAKVAQTYARMKKAVVDLPVTSKIVDGIKVVQNGAGDMVIYVKDGYIHVTSRVGETVLYMKAKVVETNGVVRVQIMEKYSSTRSMIENIASTAKTNALSAAEVAKIKVLAANDYTKQFAADKPVASSAATGAVLLGTGGGAAGLAAGGAAGNHVAAKLCCHTP